jgi:crotonobetainyl-CoA:carnitine CoA-transferase CaiB-like acyl-CoA transferase
MFTIMVDEQHSIPSFGKAGRNERRKAIATTLNALAVALVISAVVQPLTSGHLNKGLVAGALGFFLVLQGLLHYVLARVED